MAKRVTRLLATVGLAALVSACQTVREQEQAVKPEVVHAYLADKPDELKPHFYVTLTQGKRNQVLNDMRLGLAAIEMGKFELAEQLLDDALDSIETIYADNEHAAKARGLFTKELIKDFKGEPYERSMAYYYRGLLYLRAGDFDNARASFKAGFDQDALADEDQHQADFGLLQYLQGWASRCRGNTVTADDDFKQFRTINETFPLPKPDDNLLLLIETGSSPIKYSATDGNSSKPRYLKYRRASATEKGVARLAGFAASPPAKKGQKPEAPKQAVQTLDTELLEDVYRQASTRGGRPFDSILAGKAQFKEGLDTAGDVMVIAGATAVAYTASKDQNTKEDGAVAMVGLGLMVAGLIAKGVADAAEPDADTRYWDNLPDRVHGNTLRLPENVSTIAVDFQTADGLVVRSKEAPVWRAGNCGLAWVRGDSAFVYNPRAPYSTAPDAMFQPVVIPPLPSDKPAEAKAVAAEPKS